MNTNSRHLAAAEQLRLGIAKQQAGQFSAAQNHYQRAAKLDASDPQVWYLLGVCALQSDQPALAAKHFHACLKREPNSAEANNSLGVALRRMGKHSEAIDAFRAAIGARAGHVGAIYNLGFSLETVGAPDHAESAYREALKWDERDFNAANALGNLLLRRHRPADALPWLRLARKMKPDGAHTNGALAQALLDLEQPFEAIVYARTATTVEPKTAKWWGIRGMVERLLHDTENAIASLRRAIEIDPGDSLARCELGLALAEAGEIGESRTLIAAAKMDERYAQRMRWAMLLSLPSVYANEAEVDAERERFARGIEEIEATLRLDTPEQRRHAYQAACGVGPFHLEYQARDNTALHERFGDLVSRVMRAAAPHLSHPCEWRARAHGGRVRVGIVSSHLMHHTVSRYFRKLLAGLDPNRFEAHVWYSGETLDFSTATLAEHVASFEQVQEDALLSAERIRAARLDALVYPEIGMDPRHQVLGALRLAPVQCALYGHPATSGLPSIDYFLGADALEPANAQAHYRETLVRLPGLGTVPERPPGAGDGAWLDAHADGMPMALCLQNHLKLPPSFDAVLADIAARGGVRIGFFVRNAGVARRFRQRIETAFASRGLDPTRALVFLPSMRHEDYLGAIARAALILDTPGFSGGATSLDAFSVGAPVLTWQGTMARGRQTAGMLAMMGIDDLLATDADDYIDKATGLIADAPRRAALRARILERNDALFADNGVIAAFENFLDTATRKAAAGQGNFESNADAVFSRGTIFT